MGEFQYNDLTEQIINSSFEVHNVLGGGFLEKVYENALLEELMRRGVRAVSQHGMEVYYKGKIVGAYTADLVVDNKVIVELKALERLHDIHEIQLKNYLKATGIDVGLLINFGKSVEVKRKYVVNENISDAKTVF